MSLALIASNPHISERRIAPTDARPMLLKGFIKNLAWGACVSSTAGSILGCEVDDLLLPNLRFSANITLKEAVLKTGLSWTQWVERVEAELFVSEFKTSHPEKPSTVLQAAQDVPDLNRDDLELAYLAIEAAQIVIPDTPILPSITLEPANITKPTTALVVSSESPVSIMSALLKLAPTPPKAARDEASLAALKEELRMFKSAFSALDKRAKQKISAKSRLATKAIQYLRVMIGARDTLENEKNILEVALTVSVAILLISALVLF